MDLYLQSIFNRFIKIGLKKMEIEDIILLLINKTEKTRNDILNLIEKKQLEAGGTISDKAAASLVSKDLGLKLSEIVIPQPTKINDLLRMAPGSSNIIITGTIKRMYSPNQFSLLLPLPVLFP